MMAMIKEEASDVDTLPRELDGTRWVCGLLRGGQ